MNTSVVVVMVSNTSCKKHMPHFGQTTGGVLLELRSEICWYLLYADLKLDFFL